MPNTMSDAVMSVVITGRRMQASEMFMSGLGLAVADRHFGPVRQQELPVGDHHRDPPPPPPTAPISPPPGREPAPSFLPGDSVELFFFPPNRTDPAGGRARWW